jgi:hypothetical protein
MKYVQRWVDSAGKTQLYFRRPGWPRERLPGPIGSPEFVAAYEAVFNEPRVIPSTLPGGVVRSRARKNPNAVQPLIGVYLLLLRGRVVYVGESLNMPKRVAGHQSNGRPFDQVYYIATAANQRAALERILIQAINPSQNRQSLVHQTNGAKPEHYPVKQGSEQCQ